MASAPAKAATPIQNTRLDTGGISTGLNTRSVPSKESKYSLKVSTPTTARAMPAKPAQNRPVSNTPPRVKAQTAPRR